MRSEDSGGLVLIEINNINKCQLYNLTTMLNGVLTMAKVYNNISIIDNTISLYYYLGLIYFNINNYLNFTENHVELYYVKYNPMVIYSNDSNTLLLNNNGFILNYSSYPIKYLFFYLLSNTALSLLNNDFNIDICETFLECYDSNMIYIENTLFKWKIKKSVSIKIEDNKTFFQTKKVGETKKTLVEKHEHKGTMEEDSKKQVEVIHIKLRKKTDFKINPKILKCKSEKSIRPSLFCCF